MPWEIDFVTTSLAGDFALPGARRVLGSAEDGVFLSDYLAGAVADISLTGAGITVTWQQDYADQARIALALGDTAGSLSALDIARAFGAAVAGDGSGQPVFLDVSAAPGTGATLLAQTVDGVDLVVLAPGQTDELHVLRADPGGGLTSMGSLTDGAGHYAADVSDMAGITLGGATFVYVASSKEHGVSGYQLHGDGALEHVVSLGMQESLPVQTPTALDVVQVSGDSYLILAAAGTSSLTVLRIGAEGALEVTDHVTDVAGTRFQGVTALDVVVQEDQAYVFATGADQGVSLFALTENGQLSHLASVEDTAQTALDGGGGMVAQVRSGGIDLVTTSGSDPGLSLFRVTTEGHRVTSDTSGSDTLAGSSGTDVFVLTADGQPDWITGLQPDQDLLDLSAWPQFYDPSQLQLTQTGAGSLLRFGSEELYVQLAGGGGLDADAVEALIPSVVTHIDVVLQPLQISDPAPVPDLSPPAPAAPAPYEPSTDDEETPEEGAGGEAQVPSAGSLWQGSAAADTLTGGGGADYLLGQGGDDRMAGGDGDDTLAGGTGDDDLYGQAGNDHLGGGAGDDTLSGGSGHDRLGGGQGRDHVSGGIGSDALSGGVGQDTLFGGAGADTIGGGFNQDVLNGGAGADSLGGGPGRDQLEGGDGDDLLGGGEGDDLISGGAGDDFLAGGGRDDTLYGGAGDDRLNGGGGDDLLSGGDGADMFVFPNVQPGEFDEIQDFEPGLDRVWLSGVPGASKQDRFAALDIQTTSDGIVVFYGNEGGQYGLYLRGVSRNELDISDYILSL
jgi:hypothetical protein